MWVNLNLAGRKQHVRVDASSVQSGINKGGCNSEKGGSAQGDRGEAQLERLRHQVWQLATTGRSIVAELAPLRGVYL